MNKTRKSFKPLLIICMDAFLRCDLSMSASGQLCRLFSQTYVVQDETLMTLKTLSDTMAYNVNCSPLWHSCIHEYNFVIFLYFQWTNMIPSVQADGDLVSAVDFSTQYLVTGHEVIHSSFFRFCWSLLQKCQFMKQTPTNPRFPLHTDYLPVLLR